LRDQGVCAICQADTVFAFAELKRSRGRRRQELLAHWGLRRISRRTLWDADHIRPVVEGGGECDLENIRTLCLACHRQETRNLRIRQSGNAQSSCAEENTTSSWLRRGSGDGGSRLSTSAPIR
jgi:5-methylcytosine-specific restriction protein A